MTGFKLRLDGSLAGQKIAAGAVARVYRLDQMGVTQSKGARTVAIPAGSGDDFATIDADPGRYYIEAKLPTGEVLSDQVEVKSDVQELEVRLRGAPSTYDWQSWQHFAGNVDDADSDTAPLAPSTKTGTGGGWRTAAQQGAPRPEVAVISVRSGRQQWEDIARSFSGVDDAGAWLGQPQQPDNCNSGSQSFVLNSQSGSFTTDQLREFLMVRHGKSAEIASLPLPWMNRLEHCPADVLVRDQPRASSSFRTTLTVRDPNFGSALGYMTASRLESAGFLFDQAKDVLFQKVDNPLAAVAAAYVLVSNQQEPERQVWHDWIRNLMQLFPGLPDGAVQYGRLKMRDEESDSDLDEGRDALFEAFNRGIPYFSAGVRWLLTGLTVLADSDDSTAGELLKIVHPVSLRTDMSQPFTVIRMGKRVP